MSSQQAAPLDKRRHAFRQDLAAESLRGKVEAPRFAEGTRAAVMRSTAALRRMPDAGLGFDTELLFGETVRVFDTADGWCWVQADRDGYVGYVPAEVLTGDVVAATHQVSALGTFVYPGADMKLPPMLHLSINAPLAVVETGERFCKLAGHGYVMTRHITTLSKFARDFVDVAERLNGTPYLWGGRTRVGVDCSGLVQIAMQAAGLVCPRDSDMQLAEVGANLLVQDPMEGLARGDLVFWSGHVGIMVDGMMLLHANAHHMAVVVEPLSAAIHRIGKTGSEIRGIKRPAALSAGPARAEPQPSTDGQTA